jgi:hypothetical protein
MLGKATTGRQSVGQSRQDGDKRAYDKAQCLKRKVRVVFERGESA